MKKWWEAEAAVLEKVKAEIPDLENAVLRAEKDDPLWKQLTTLMEGVLAPFKLMKEGPCRPLESLNRKIKTAKDLLGVVKTMKSLAAVNIRQFERAVESLEQYRGRGGHGVVGFSENGPSHTFPVPEPGGCLPRGGK